MHATQPAPQSGAHAPPAMDTGVPSEPGIVRLQADYDARRTTVLAVTQHYLARIQAIDVNGPALKSVLEVNPDAERIAGRLDERQQPRGLLYGVPVMLKDNIDTADRMHTTAGSLALMDSRPTRDAFLVGRLRAAGAVILAKTNMSEWANFRSKRSSSGWSGRGGQTRNPYATDRDPCGSSSGSAVAVAADLTVLAVGTETDGSIVCPASMNGIVGLKPTVGLVSRSGIIPISASQDTAGPMARTVTDAAMLLTVLAGYDPEDPATAPLKGRPPVDYRSYLDADGLKGRRIGVLRQFAGFHEGVDAEFDRALAALRAHGAILVDPVRIPDTDKLGPDELTVLLYEFKDGINRYLATRQGTGPRTLAELIAFNQANAAREMPYFLQELFLDAQATDGLMDPRYLQAHERARRRARAGIDGVLAKYHLAALVAPTMGPAPTIDLINGDHMLGGDVATVAAVAGYPHLTVPMGQVHGLPVGISFLGPAWSEGPLLRLGYAYEQATHERKPPALP
ncbi:MAG TPA: amidase [Steroidobacteraceae bacterium]|nr:amidase [Steroidobacteraceae bacterium]